MKQKIFMELRPGVPIFTLATTGGAAAMLSRNPEYQDRVRAMDLEAENLVRSFWEEQEGSAHKEPRRDDSANASERRKFYVPYAMVAQQIVAQIIEHADYYRRREEVNP